MNTLLPAYLWNYNLYGIWVQPLLSNGSQQTPRILTRFSWSKKTSISVHIESWKNLVNLHVKDWGYLNCFIMNLEKNIYYSSMLTSDKTNLCIKSNEKKYLQIFSTWYCCILMKSSTIFERVCSLLMDHKNTIAKQ